ncbi:hypothetical protein [Bradyrhizobium diazoefficiens]|uniref:hypothetical protein n=1 Tax=Bradyrhizobium diazoefficiens TaxID=1355477 RepID=UPI0010600FA4|nr:hypothetical protein [Bradyrhizobium diazoefficiens]BCF40405.1 hypothetical protein XF16B_08950 [Bradyrhizobium diazoefficiens]BCF66543.1 hypothetical protein XF19B_08960 [Bradyrhizobium diazoefficiens]
MSGDTKVERTSSTNAKPDRRHSSTILTDLRNRLVNLCSENSRDDLADAAYLLHQLASTNLGAMQPQRKRMISILANDDDLLKTAEHLELVYQALTERQVGTALH